MNLKEQIQHDMRESARAKEGAKLSTLRMLFSAVRQQEIDTRQDLDDAGVAQVIGKMVKQREESAALYESGGRADLAGKEREEKALLETYLPEQLAEDEIDRILGRCVGATGATSPRDMGRVMVEAKKEIAGRADMSAVSAKVRQLLQR